MIYISILGAVSAHLKMTGESGMGCIKCGKKTKDEQTFCSRCLEVMEAYPVPSDVHVQLPSRPTASGKKSSRKRRAVSAEEKVLVLRRKLRRRNALVVLLTLLLAGTVFLLLWQYNAPEEDAAPNGQNFIVDETMK